MDYVVEDIAPALTALGCYERRDEFIRRVVPDFGADWRCKWSINNPLHHDGYNLTMLVVEWPEPHAEEIADADRGLSRDCRGNDMKQRTRKQIEYYHADRLKTMSRLERRTGLSTIRAFLLRTATGLPDP